jgi:predicted lipoprotein with Yx(FWY)xxD motif
MHHQADVGRIAAAAFAVGGLTASLIAMGTAGASTTHAAKSVTVTTMKSKTLGTLLVSGSRTVYTLKPSKTACAAACQKFWPEVVLPTGVTKASAGTGVSAAKLGTIMRANGVRQVTYGGKPLYWFALDKKAGEVNGNVTDTWGTWKDVVTVKPTTSSGGTTAPTTTAPSGGGSAF